MISADLVRSVKMHEGLRLRSYQDSEGVWTIGYGRNLQVMEINDELANHWLLQDLSDHQADAMALAEWTLLNPARRDVITEMTFNLGIISLMTFRRMWACINALDWDGAADEMLDSQWYSQVGERAERLARRMREGV